MSHHTRANTRRKRTQSKTWWSVVYATGLLVSCTLLLTVEEAYHRSLRTHADQRHCHTTVSVHVQSTATVAAAAAAAVEPVATFSFVPPPPPPRRASLPSSIRVPVARAAVAEPGGEWGEEQGRRANGGCREGPALPLPSPTP